jgi:mRNA interferase RelE/StbE
MAEKQYRLIITPSAKKQLLKLPKHIVVGLNATIAQLKEDPRPFGHKKMVNRQAYRVRHGNYRIIYQVDDDEVVVLVLAVGHRKDIYRN